MKILFLDRDGVINKKLDDDYVKNWSEFEFMPNIKEVLTKLKPLFDKIVVVTNQQGIGKKIMTEQDLHILHQKMLSELHDSQVLIDKIYHCPSLANANDPNRKPNIGMAKQVLSDFPKADFSQSWIIGDSISDMEFGKKAGLNTIFFGQKKHEFIDFSMENWLEIQEFFV